MGVVFAYRFITRKRRVIKKIKKSAIEKIKSIAEDIRKYAISPAQAHYEEMLEMSLAELKALAAE